MAKEKGISLDRRKGQYILMDRKVIKRQVDFAQLTGCETVLEIGPGPGTLTFPLAEMAAKVIAVEKDGQFVSYLEDRIPKNVSLICADVLKIDLPEFDVCVSNLPYQISSPVTFKLLKHSFKRAVLMYQKEFAERMVAKAASSSYSRLSVNVFYKAHCRILELVPKEAFKPHPKVDGAIIELIPRPPPFSVKVEEVFFEIVKVLFGKRRKKIKNSLMDYVLSRTKGFSQNEINDFLKSLPQAELRVEQLSPQMIGEVSDEIADFILSSSN